MKTFILTGLVSMACFGRLTADIQDFPVTPTTLAGWQVTGMERTVLQGQDRLTLPAGVELTRAFAGGAVILGGSSRPYFGSAPADWPVVQVGPAALTLTRQGDRGQLALVVGGTVRILPGEIALDATGRSQEPLELALGYDPVSGIGVVAFAGQTVSFTSTVNVVTTEVSVAAGERSPWEHDALEVGVIRTDIATDGARPPPAGTAVAGRSAVFQSATARLRQAGETAGAAAAAAGTETIPARTTGRVAGTATLEIFTPPSVRHGPAAVRAAVAKSRRP